MKQPLGRMTSGLCVAVAFFMLGMRLDATSTHSANAMRTNWSCHYSSEFEWCNEFDVHNSEWLGGGGKTVAYAEAECQFADVGSASWFTGDTNLDSNGYDEQLSSGYVESSSSSLHPNDSSFFGWYTLHSAHWYDGDPWWCGSGDLDTDMHQSFEIT